MLTTREGGAMASAPKCMEDDGEASNVGVNDLGDGGATMRVLRRSQPWEAEAALQKKDTSVTFWAKRNFFLSYI